MSLPDGLIGQMVISSGFSQKEAGSQMCQMKSMEKNLETELCCH